MIHTSQLWPFVGLDFAYHALREWYTLPRWGQFVGLGFPDHSLREWYTLPKWGPFVGLGFIYHALREWYTLPKWGPFVGLGFSDHALRKWYPHSNRSCSGIFRSCEQSMIRLVHCPLSNERKRKACLYGHSFSARLSLGSCSNLSIEYHDYRGWSIVVEFSIHVVHCPISNERKRKACLYNHSFSELLKPWSITNEIKR